MGEDAGDAQAVDTLRAEVTHWQEEAARADVRAAEAFAEREALREQMRAADEASERATEETASLQARLVESLERERAATARYRALVLESDPSLPPELLRGDTIEAIEESRAAARELVGRVKSRIEEEAQSARVPAGSPPRSAPDVSAMTPEQKIRHGLSRR